VKIAVLMKGPFPEGMASSSYVLNVCRVIASCGHRVKVFGCARSKTERFSATGEIDGISYKIFPAFSKTKPIVYLYDNFWGRYITDVLKKEGQFDVVLLFGGRRSEAKRVFSFCKKNKFLYGAFDCEWFTSESFSNSVSPRIVTDSTALIPFNVEHADFAILISSLLLKHFQKQKVPSIFIPNIVDLNEAKWCCRKSLAEKQVLKLAYAGVPGVGKDELGTVFSAISTLPEEKKGKVELHIYGSTDAQLKNYLDLVGVREVPEGVFCHGRKAQHEIPAFLNECHYTVLIRKPTLRANAGFSTKMVESFAAGIPMIANLTGDIGTYLKDSENGIVVRDDSVEACRDAILKAFELLPRNTEMRKAALDTATEHFDYRKYVSPMKEFLSQFE